MQNKPSQRERESNFFITSKKIGYNSKQGTMKRLAKFFSAAAILTIVLATSCTSYKNVPYMQNSDSVSLNASHGLYDAKIMPKDILTITVNCPEDPTAARNFNLVTQTNDVNNPGSTQGSRLSTQQSLQQYLVSNDGNIEFPMLGTLHVAGLTKTQLEETIANKVTGTYLKNKPIVIVNMANYKVTVLGEVSRAGIYTASNGKINIFEALAQAGDMTIYGRRDCVKVIREDANGEKKIVELNLNDANIILSPYYQLQQNDIVYVTPNKAKAKNSGIGSETSLWFTSTSILVSLASLLYNILK